MMTRAEMAPNCRTAITTREMATEVHYIRMRGLPFRASDDDIRAFFKSARTSPTPYVNILQVSVEYGADGRPTGEALMQVASQADSEKAMEFHRHMLGTRYVELKRCPRPDVPFHHTGECKVLGPLDPTGASGPEKRSRSTSPGTTRKLSRSQDKLPGAVTGADGALEEGRAGIRGGAAVIDESKRVYVGNLPQEPDVCDSSVGTFINQAMHQSSLVDSSGFCVESVWLNPLKQFAFVQLRSDKEATAALGLDGITWMGTALRINRPKAFSAGTPEGSTKTTPSIPIAVPSSEAASARAASTPALPATDLKSNPTNAMDTAKSTLSPESAAAAAAAAVAAISEKIEATGGGPRVGANRLTALMQATKKARRIHVGNLPVNVGLTSPVLKAWVDAVMQQMALVVMPGEPVIDVFVSSEGKFGFVEMRTIAEASNALLMTGADCFGRAIRVGRPADYAAPPPELLQQCEGSGLLGTPEDISAGGAARDLYGLEGAGPDIRKATEVVAIKYMISDAALACDAECRDIAEETIAKCEEEFGRIVCLMICRPQQQNVPRELVGQCLVQFEDVPSAIKAAQGLNHAKFDDRLVETSFADVAVMARLQGLLPPAARG